MPTEKAVQYTGRKGITTQNVLAVCDFDMRFTFVLAGWPGLVHDMRVFNDALEKFGDKFPHPPLGMYGLLHFFIVFVIVFAMLLTQVLCCVDTFYLVDSGYPNRPGFLVPYRGTKYHVPEWREGHAPRGKKELFNYTHSSLRNVIERSFGVLKMKWRILLHLPSFSMAKQSKIIMACMALHNFIRQSGIMDDLFDLCDQDENYDPNDKSTSSAANRTNRRHGDEDQRKNQFRDWIADGLFSRS